MKKIEIIILVSLLLIGCNNKKDNFEILDSVYYSGIDLSHHNCCIEWNKLDVDFVYLKATEGSTFTDPSYKEYRDKCFENNIPVGAYHFFSCQSSGESQFNNFKNVVGRKINLKPVLDIETRTISKCKLRKELCDWINACYDYYKTYPIIYTSDIFYIKNLKDNYTISKCQVWLGDVNVKSYKLKTPYIMHQIKICKIQGTKYPVDYNILYCNLNEIIMAKKLKVMDTSVEITYKDGTVNQYDSLNEASEASGLSEAAIKIRCNKCRAGSANKKDRIHCRWLNDTTFRSYQSKKSRHKGGALETEVVNKLKEIGYSGVCRAAGESRTLDNNKIDIADVNNELEYAIQCKYTQNLPNYYTIREACTDPRDMVLIWKKVAEENSISKGTLAILPVNLFYKLIAKKV